MIGLFNYESDAQIGVPCNAYFTAGQPAKFYTQKIPVDLQSSCKKKKNTYRPASASEI